MVSKTAEFKKVLTLFPVVLFGLAYMVPLTIFTTYGIVSQITGGMLPAAYTITLVTMLFTAYSYGKMVKVFPYAGTAYSIHRNHSIRTWDFSPAGYCCSIIYFCR